MQRMLKLFFGLVVVALGFHRAEAFSIKGPYESFQDPVIGYVDADLGGPHNLGEEYRRNTPVIYYTFDQTFLDYFGSNGVAAVEEAFAILNSVTNVSSYSRDLSEWPMEAQRFNFRAQALFLTDLKSATLGAMMEQMGLAEAERFVWALHDRDPLPGASCPVMEYIVIKRNFDPVPSPLDQFQPTSYVNGTLYTYLIEEVCSGSPVLADALEIAVDPLANAFTSVSSQNLPQGAFYTGLTRDDIGGLRYLLKTNNVNIEDPGSGTLTVFTNTAVSQLLFTSNLALLVSQSLTNTTADLLALYPDLVISSTTPLFTNVVSTNVFFYFTNLPWAPAGTFSVAFQTNRTTNVVTLFSRTFQNVVTNSYYTSGFVTILTTNITTAACGPFTPVGSPPCTNISTKTVFTNFINGDYYILPTNSECGVFIVNTQLTSVLNLTNNTVTATNAPGVTNVNGQQFSQTQIYYFTNNVFVIHPVPCLTTNNEPRQGIEHIQFVRYDGAYDPLLDVYSFPITNTYELVSVPLTNSTPTPRRIIRPIRRPDIIFTAQDLTTEQSVTVRGGTYSLTGFGWGTILRNVPWVPNNLFNVEGPGTIAPNVEIAFNKVGPVFVNQQPSGLDEASQLINLGFFVWGSFDGSTNAPVVYPNGTSIENYEMRLLINVEPPYLPQGYLTSTVLHTNFYSVQLTVTSYTPSFVPPVTWALAPGSAGMPPGLNLNGSTGEISGTPTMVGTFDFVVRLTDSGGRTFDRAYTITIAP